MNVYPTKALVPLSRPIDKREVYSGFVSSIDHAVLGVFLLLMLQGLFLDQITRWVVERRYIIFSLLPFNLYPSDLFLLPGLFLLAVFSKKTPLYLPTNSNRNHLFSVLILVWWGIAVLLGQRIDALKTGNTWMAFDSVSVFLLIPLLFILFNIRRLRVNPVAERQLLLLLWWTACLLGLLNGFLSQTSNLLGDGRELILRSLIAAFMFYLGLRTNFVWLSNKLISFGVLFAIVFDVVSIARLAGLNFAVSFLGVPDVHMVLPLLLPLSLALTKALTEKSNKRLTLWLYPILIASGILLTVSKPAVGALVACTVVTIFITRQNILSSLGTAILYLVLMISVVLGLLWLFDGVTAAEQHVRSAYLKQDYVVQDLSGTRFTIWQRGIEAWLEKPIIGHGFGYLLSGKTVDIGNGSDIYLSVIWPHNIFIQLLMQTGLVGVGLVIIIVWGWLTQVLGDTKIISNETRWIHASMVAVPVTIGLMAMYGQFLGNMHGGFLLWACVGLEAAFINQIYLRGRTDTRLHE